MRCLAAAPLLLVLLPLVSPPRRSDGQDLGNLLSPGKLSKPHAKLEGLDNCQKCHEPGRKVTAEKCLACHQPVAERIAAKKGVHRDVRGDCVSCHVEHAGVDAELRPFDPKTFDHKAETGIRARRPARDDRRQVPELPQDAVVPDRAAGLRFVPRGQAQGPPRARLRELPLDGRPLQGRREDLRPLEGRLPADRRPRDDPLRVLPQDARLPHREVRRLQRLPPGSARQAARRLRVVPHDGDLPRRTAHRARQDRLPAGRQACPGPLRDLPRQAADEGPPEGRQVRRLPRGPAQGGLQGRRLRVLPQGDRLQAGGAVRPRAEDGLRPRRRPRDGRRARPATRARRSRRERPPRRPPWTSAARRRTARAATATSTRASSASGARAATR